MVEDPNQGFGSPIKQENSQTKIPHSLESSKAHEESQIPGLSKEFKRVYTSEDL